MFPRHSTLLISSCRKCFHSIVHRSWCSQPVPSKRNLKSVSKDQGAVSANRLEKEVRHFFKEIGSESILSQLPTELLNQRPKQTDCLYIATAECASIVRQHVTAGLSADALLAEVNPGPGLLTRELLKDGVQRLMLVEDDEQFEPVLRSLMATYRDVDWSLKVANFNGHWRQVYYDSEDSRRKLQDLLEGMPRKRWKDEPNIRLFSIVDSTRFFKAMMGCLANQTGLFSRGRCEMVLVLPPLVYVQLTCTKAAGYAMYRQQSVMFQLLFEHELLGTIPRRHILPWAAKPPKRKIRSERQPYEQTQQDEWYLMRIVPRKDLHDFCLPDDLKLLRFFVYQHLISRTNRIIPALEKWIPYCGCRLILNQNYVPSIASAADKDQQLPFYLPKSLPLRRNDYPERVTIFTKFGELTPSQILTIFNDFISWPEFRQSAFVQSAEQNQLRPMSLTKRSSSDAIAADEDDEREVEKHPTR
ncbi:dimethyladenosine transferase 2, mitochondrial [Wyeomyia smithii]|uniref:dimethyladenosine transferase 2, mitochondrial n=1 Tax=Wyeomyia smithii TaxID=174621 RepID=UPI002467C267|nr:dimethyladenosine transferase 2, mitochondrial [Wyeomyia smithii]